MRDYMTLRIGQDAPLMSLTGQRISIVYLIVHETKKAILVAVVKNSCGECLDAQNYWFPKSVIQIDGERPRCLTANESKEASVIQIPEWLWSKKEPAKPMGAMG